MKKLKRSLSILLSCVLMLTYIMPPAVYAADSDSVDGTTADYAWFGDGSASTFEISSASDLVGFANIVNGCDNQTPYNFSEKTIILTADIDLGQKAWAPIGAETEATNPQFCGIFNGNFHTISGLATSDGSCIATDMNGLFGYNAGIIENLKVTGNVAVTSSTLLTGGIAAFNVGTVINCCSNIQFSLNNINYDGNTLGGLVGINCKTIANCRAAGNVQNSTASDLSNLQFGGISCYSEGNIINCINTIDVSDITSVPLDGAVSYAEGSDQTVLLKNIYGPDTISSWSAQTGDNVEVYNVKGLPDSVLKGGTCTGGLSFSTNSSNSMIIDENTSDAIIKALNYGRTAIDGLPDGVSAKDWTYDTDGYPTINFTPADNGAPLLSDVTTAVSLGGNINVKCNKDAELYLVPKPAADYTLKSELDAAVAQGKTEACSTEILTPIGTAGLEPGLYQIYAVDSLGQLSLPSHSINILMPADYSWYGNGSASTFYISTAAQLRGLANITNGQDGQTQYGFAGKTIELTNDIDLGSKEWTPIGLDYFGGIFNGNYHTISNLSSTTAASMAGLIGYTETMVENLRVTGNITLSGNEFYAGGIVAMTYGELINCSADMNITVASCPDNAYVGSLAGYCSSLLNCAANGTISADNSVDSANLYAGGLTGGIRYGGIVNCCSSVAVPTFTGSAKIGDIAGACAHATLNNIFWAGSKHAIYGSDGGSNAQTNCEEISDAVLKGSACNTDLTYSNDYSDNENIPASSTDAVIKALNSGRAAITALPNGVTAKNWSYGSNGYPVPDFLGQDTSIPLISHISTSVIKGGAVTGMSSKNGTLYLVPKPETNYTQKSELIASLANGGKSTVCAAGIVRSFDTASLADGTYQIYAVDDLGQVSSPSPDITVYEPDASTDVWDGTSASYSWYGNGSQSTFYISTGADLKGFANLINGTDGKTATGMSGKTIVLTRNIDLGGHEWEPIGGNIGYQWFSGCFDGKNHTISNLCITAQKRNIGLFGVLDSKAFKNLNVTGNITVTLKNGMSSYAQEGIFAGGIIGYSYTGPIMNCSSNVNLNVTVEDSNNTLCSFAIGGIIGSISPGNNEGAGVFNCFSRGSISIKGNNSYGYGHIFGGGIAGAIRDGSNLANCYSTASLSSSGNTSATFLGTIIGGKADGSTAENYYWNTDNTSLPGIGKGIDFEGKEKTLVNTSTSFAGLSNQVLQGGASTIPYNNGSENTTAANILDALNDGRSVIPSTFSIAKAKGWNYESGVNDGLPVWEDSYATTNSFSPANGATAVPNDTQLNLTFSEPVTGISGKYIFVMNAANDTIACKVGADSSISSGNTVTVTLPQKLAYNTSYYIIVDSGAFENASGNGCDAIDSSTTWAFTTDMAPNSAPTASQVTIAGTCTVGQTLTGQYKYSDAENDPQGTSTFKWYRSDDAQGLNKQEITDAYDSTYTLAPADFGKFISFEVTPVASAGNTTGAAVESEFTSAVAVSDVSLAATTLANATYNANYSTVTLNPAVGGSGSYTYLITGTLPAGMSFDSADHSISGTPTQAGTYNFTIRAADTLDTSKYAETTLTLVVNKATPTVSAWPTVSDITYGQIFGNAIDISKANASISGTFSVEDETIVPNASSTPYTKNLIFTPTDTDNYEAVTFPATITVNKATPTVSAWPTVSAVAYGQTFGNAIDSSKASASVSGTFSIEDAGKTPDASATPYTKNLIFTPSDTTNYNVVSNPTSVTVNKATPIVSAWPTVSDITYGQIFGNAIDVSKAETTVAGTFSIQDSSNKPDASATPYSKNLVFTPDDLANYNIATIPAEVTVNKANAAISDIVCDNKTYDGSALAPTTEVTEGSGSIAYSYTGEGITGSTTQAPCNAGTYTVTATLSATTNYNEAVKTKTVTISKAAQSDLLIINKPETTVYGDTFTLATSGGSGAGDISWLAVGGAVITQSGTVNINGIGDVIITATKAGDNNYDPIVATYTFTPGKATPNIGNVTATSIYVGDSLRDSNLSRTDNTIAGTLSWDKNDSFSSTTAGTKTATYSFTPSGDDANKYNSITGQTASVAVNTRGILSVSAPSAIESKPYGTAQSDLGLPVSVQVTVQGVSGEVVRNVPVIWSGYKPDTLSTQTLTGTIDLTGNNELNNDKNLTVSISVTLQPLTAKTLQNVSAKIKAGSTDAAELLSALVTNQFDETVDADATKTSDWTFPSDYNTATSSAQTITVRVYFKQGYAPKYQDVKISYDVVNPDKLTYTTAVIPQINATDAQNASQNDLLKYINGYSALTAVWPDDAVGTTAAANNAPAYTALPTTYVQTGTNYILSQNYLGNIISQSVTVSEIKNKVPELNINYNSETINTTSIVAYSIDGGDWNPCGDNMPISSLLGKTITFKTIKSGYMVDSDVTSILIPEREAAPTNLSAVINDNKNEISISGLENGTAYEYSLDGITYKELNSGKIPVSDYQSQINIRKKYIDGKSLHSESESVDVKYIISFDSNGGSAIDPIYAASGTVIQAPNKPNLSGFSFIGWYSSKDSSGKAIEFPYTINGNVTVYAKWQQYISGGGSSGGSQGGSNSNDQSNTGTPTVGTSSTTTTASGQSVTTVSVDEGKLENILNGSDNPSVIIPVSGNADVVVGELNGQMVKNMEQKESVLEIKTDSASYTLPASEINIDDVSKQLGSDVTLKDIKVNVSISKPAAETATIVEQSSVKGGFSVAVQPVDFDIQCSNGGKTVNISHFNSYVERTIAIPDGVDPTKITTGVTLNPDGTIRHIPTQVTVIDGHYYAKINSLTNSTYFVIWNPIEFSDMQNHWAKDAVNDMGSRLVVNGVGNKNYDPDRSMTRAEFAAIIVRALGLPQFMGDNSFTDVGSSDWFCGYIETAETYGIINGYGNGKFGPNDLITREQAMAMIARAMKVTGLKLDLSDGDVNTILSKSSDGKDISDYAKESVAACLKTEVVFGEGENCLITPKSNVTRAEVATIVQRLLKKSDLIN
ncbi:MAG: S-layer homology domain-containing protein [Bacillota bacterium]|nr:S-layer homology domain-containing protein [Bacillota bacterium]